MSKILLLPLLFAILIGPTVGNAFAAFDSYLEIEGIDGEASAENHKGEIEISSWSWGVSNSGSMAAGGGGGAGKASFSDFHITKTVDKSSPKLMEAVATGEHLKSLTMRKSGGNQQEYYIIHLSDIVISSYSTSSGSGDKPIEEVSFTYQKIEFEYIPTNADGTAAPSVKAGWDLAKNVKA